MTGINADKIAQLQEDWENTNSGILTQAQNYLSDLYRIKKGLEDMGLDLTQDATYELLDVNLNKQDFDQHYTYLSMLAVLENYHVMQTQRQDYINVQASRHYHSLDRFLNFTYPKYEEALAAAPLPDANKINPLHLREIDFINTLYQDGTLNQQLKHAALAAAFDEYRTSTAHKKSVEANIAKGESYYRASAEGLASSNRILKLIDAAGDAYAPQDIYADYSMFGGWDKKAGTIKFSRENAQAQRDYFLIKELGVKFGEALIWQAKGHFVLDASGSGHGMMVMPMQDIALKLQDYGYDLNDAATFTTIGTDIATFSKAYQDERSAVAKNDQYNLLKPALKI